MVIDSDVRSVPWGVSQLQRAGLRNLAPCRATSKFKDRSSPGCHRDRICELTGPQRWKEPGWLASPLLECVCDTSVLTMCVHV